jgi:hypothetical protein
MKDYFTGLAFVSCNSESGITIYQNTKNINMTTKRKGRSNCL